MQEMEEEEEETPEQQEEPPHDAVTEVMSERALTQTSVISGPSTPDANQRSEEAERMRRIR